MMPFDFFGSRLSGRISDLDKWIAALENAETAGDKPYFVNQFTPEIKAQIINYFRAERRHLEAQLSRHQQQDKESGVKY